MDSLDDFVGVDALQVDRGHAEIAVPEFALNDVQRPGLLRRDRGLDGPEVLFYLALTLGLEGDPIGAVERAVGLVEASAATGASTIRSR